MPACDVYDAILVDASILKGVFSCNDKNLSGTSTVNDVSDTPSGILVSPSIVCSNTTFLDVLLFVLKETVLPERPDVPSIVTVGSLTIDGSGRLNILCFCAIVPTVCASNTGVFLIIFSLPTDLPNFSMIV